MVKITKVRLAAMKFKIRKILALISYNIFPVLFTLGKLLTWYFLGAFGSVVPTYAAIKDECTSTPEGAQEPTHDSIR